ncbi:MAG: DNA translocase FtsK [Chloroflexota bacterium]|nr:DNA translocase FtsK [Chloroflexota bacterium]
MAKKKTNGKGTSERKPRRRPGWSRFSHFLMLRPVRWVLLTVIILLVLISQRSAIFAWATDVANSTWALFGAGLILIVVALAVLVVVAWRRKLSSLVHRWNWWLGGFVFFAAAWGILALLGLGGNIGLGIAGSADFLGVLRTAGIIILGLIFVAPRKSFRLARRFAAWLVRKFRRPTVPQPVSIARPASVAEPAAPPKSTRARQPQAESAEAPVAAAAAGEEPKSLKQVAQEVWKKYGQSGNPVIVDGWQLPPIDILDRSTEVELTQADNVQRAKRIEEALASYGVEAKVAQINNGPTVTQFGVEPGWERKTKGVKERDRDGNVKIRQEEVSKTRVKVERITSLANDLALALAASSIRIEAPVPGTSVVGIEVPNTVSSSVSLRGVIETSSFQKMESKSKLTIAMGKGAGGEAVAGDLTKMPHLLIAGATGSGKTVCLNSIVCCLLLHNTPNDVKFIMIDPKRVELTPYNGIPHMAVPVIVETERALGALRWLNMEMDKRYQLMAASSARNVESYNRNRQGTDRLPYLVLVIDELADLMMTGFDEVEHILCRLAQLSRATGIHLIVATQRPSVDVVTGLIKANFPTRISFAVTSQVDSRTILDTGGAEKLLGRGDMLYMPTEAAKPKRLQGCFVSDPETERLVYFWSSQRKEEAVQLKIDEFSLPSMMAKRDALTARDPMLESARQLAEEHHQHISTSFLQRRLHIGYPRAARIMEQLEEEGLRGGKEERENE